MQVPSPRGGHCDRDNSLTIPSTRRRGHDVGGRISTTASPILLILVLQRAVSASDTGHVQWCCGSSPLWSYGRSCVFACRVVSQETAPSTPQWAGDLRSGCCTPSILMYFISIICVAFCPCVSTEPGHQQNNSLCSLWSCSLIVQKSFFRRGPSLNVERSFFSGPFKSKWLLLLNLFKWLPVLSMQSSAKQQPVQDCSCAKTKTILPSPVKAEASKNT